MILYRGQRFRFLGRDGSARAAQVARELHGRCTATANEVQMTHDVELVPKRSLPLMQPAPSGRATAFQREDFR